jgi:hypothetical protein
MFATIRRERTMRQGGSNVSPERKRWYAWADKRPVIPEIVAYRRKYLFNAGGFRGIRWDRHWDTYQVLSYDHCGVWWMGGDEADELLPGWGGDRWFPDRTAALVGRDNRRRLWPTLMLPDEEDEGEW